MRILQGFRDLTRGLNGSQWGTLLYKGSYGKDLSGDLMGSHWGILLYKGDRKRDLTRDLKGVLGVSCDLIEGISCGSLTLKGISW